MKWTSEQVPRLEGALAVVTGANSGIGFETARILAQRGARVVLACRNAERAAAAQAKIVAAHPVASVETSTLDLSDLASIEAFSKRLVATESQLDLLINNAGVMMPGRHTETTDGFELQIGVNHLGHFALTCQLLPLLNNAPAARVVNVASLAHYKGRMNLDDLHYRNRTYWRVGSYGQSKLANLLFTFELDRRLKTAGERTIALASHPGWTSTDLQRHMPSPGAALFRAVAMSAARGALPSLRAATDQNVSGGEYFGPKGMTGTHGFPVLVGCSKAARDQKSAAKLWAISEKMTRIT